MFSRQMMPRHEEYLRHTPPLFDYATMAYLPS